MSAQQSIFRIDQYFFNRKKLQTKKRIDLLKVLLAASVDGNDKINSLSLMTNLYSIKWYEHPDMESQQRTVELYLRYLEDIGDLKKIGHDYVLSGHALKAIEDYEEQERKHTETVKVQRKMVMLTVVLVLLTLAQAGVVKLPLVLDFASTQKSSTSTNSKSN